MTSCGFGGARSRTAGSVEWHKDYLQNGKAYQVSIMVSTDPSGVSPLRLEGSVVTKQEVLPATYEDLQLWLERHKAEQRANAHATDAGLPFWADLTYLVKQAVGDYSGAVDVPTCFVCQRPAASWKLNAEKETVCVQCL